MRYAYPMTALALVAGTAATMLMQTPSSAQTAQNEPGAISAAAPKVGAPMSFADMVAKLQPAVVNISTTSQVKVAAQTNPFAGTPFGDLFGGGSGGGQPVTREQTSLGSGFIISADGYIVTNNHVISGGQANNAPVGQITVTMSDRKEYQARLIGRDATSDLAVLKIDGANLPFVRFGDSANSRVGDWVVAIGQPYGLGGTVTAGIVSAIHRSINGGPFDRFIQTDAAINSGNSGGPMFDLNGNVIGINSMIFSPSGGNVGIGFAIPAELAKPIVDQLRGGAKIKRGYLGIQIRQLDDGMADALGLPKNRGEFVGGVEPGQPAMRAGIKQGDVIVKVNGRDVTPDESLSFIVANLPVGSKVPIELIRDGKRLSVVATLIERPSEEALAGFNQQQQGDDGTLGGDDQQADTVAATNALGLTVQPLTAIIARQIGVPEGTQGVVISGADPSSDASAKGLKRGDVILQINQRPVVSGADVAAAVNAARAAGRSNVLVYARRGSAQPQYVPIKLKPAK
ncbi:putative periplasmic serine endoprotease DegP-like [Sphingomonas antarctica]|uniref:Do family serine endopeptidase n=1 Tax=Sphingomonas antarctica TaxID=2040274 RepID=UPI0039EA0A2F